MSGPEAFNFAERGGDPMYSMGTLGLGDFSALRVCGSD